MHLSFSAGKEIATQPLLEKPWKWILFLLFCHQVHPVGGGAYILNGTSEHESNVWEFSMCLHSEGSQGSLDNDGNAQTGPCWCQLCEHVPSRGALPATPAFAQLPLFRGSPSLLSVSCQLAVLVTENHARPHSGVAVIQVVT